jgi:GntR family transcriptional regulator
VQIVRQIRLTVASGRIGPGERLPSARDLAADLKVNFHTVRKAYGDLERQGLVRSDRGKGTFVAPEVETLGPRRIRRVVREHIERLAEDLAGAEVPLEDLKEILQEELARAFERGRVAP